MGISPATKAVRESVAVCVPLPQAPCNMKGLLVLVLLSYSKIYKRNYKRNYKRTNYCKDI